MAPSTHIDRLLERVIGADRGRAARGSPYRLASLAV